MTVGRGHRRAGDHPAVSIVVPTWEGAADWVGDCLEALVAQEAPVVPEIVVCLDGDAPSAEAVVRRLVPAARMIRGGAARGFASSATAGLRASKGALVAVVNDDAVVQGGWLGAILAASGRHPDAGSFASRVLRAEDPSVVDSAGHGLTRWGEAFDIGQGCADGPTFDAGAEVFGAPACAAVYRRELLEDCGGFDAAMEAYLEDVDLSLRAQLLGFPCRYVPEARVHHRGGASYGARAERLVARNRVRLMLRSMPRNVLRAGLPAAAASLGAGVVRSAMRGRLEPLVGMAEGVRGARAALGERPAALGRRRVADGRIREVLLASEARLAELAAASDASRLRRSRGALADRLGRWVDRREQRLARPLW